MKLIFWAPVEIKPKIRTIELTKIAWKYARNTQEGDWICDNPQTVDDINLQQPSLNICKILIKYILQVFKSIRFLFELVQKHAY